MVTRCEVEGFSELSLIVEREILLTLTSWSLVLECLDFSALWLSLRFKLTCLADSKSFIPSSLRPRLQNIVRWRWAIPLDFLIRLWNRYQFVLLRVCYPLFLWHQCLVPIEITRAPTRSSRRPVSPSHASPLELISPSFPPTKNPTSYDADKDDASSYPP